MPTKTKSRTPANAPTESIGAFVSSRLQALADPRKAREMAAYMKTSQPFYGVQQPDRDPIFREMIVQYAPANGGAYRSGVLSLWAAGQGDGLVSAPAATPNTVRPRKDSAMIPPVYSGPREMMYAACRYGQAFDEHLTPAHLPLFKRLITDGGWWDLVDEVATHMIAPIMLTNRQSAGPIMDKWLEDDNLWVRRASLICQLGHKDRTDPDRLFNSCLKRADETDFFIRKAIGWALRSYAWTDPEAVGGFLKKHADKLSPLSVREAGKNLAPAKLAPTKKPRLAPAKPRR